MNKKLFWFVLGMIVMVVFFIWTSHHISDLIKLSSEHPYIAPFIAVIWRIISIVIPPLPGGIISFALIPVFGWFWSFVWASIGTLIGMSLSFYLARTLGKPFVHVFISPKKLGKWEKKFEGNTEFFAFLGLRIVMAPIFDFIAYIAGLSKMRFSTFFFVNILALLPEGVLYWAGGELYKRSIYLAAGVLVVGAIFYYVWKRLHVKKHLQK